MLIKKLISIFFPGKDGFVVGGPLVCAFLILGVSVQLIGFLGMPAVMKHWPSRSFLEPFVMIAHQAEASASHQASESANLLDSEPLFLPTEHNASLEWKERSAAEAPTLPENYEIDSRLELPDRLQGERMDFTKANFLKDRPSSFSLLNRVDMVPLFASFNQVARPIERLNQRVAHMEVWDVSGREMIKAIELKPEDIDLGSKMDWQRVEYNIIVEGNGMAYHPLLTRSSGNQNLDDAFSGYLYGNPRVLRDLDAGYYQVKIGQ